MAGRRNTSPSDTSWLNGHRDTSPSDTGRLNGHHTSPSDTGRLNGHRDTSPSDTGRLNGHRDTSPSDTGRLNGHHDTSPSDTGRLNGHRDTSPSDTGRLNGHLLCWQRIRQVTLSQTENFMPTMPGTILSISWCDTFRFVPTCIPGSKFSTSQTCLDAIILIKMRVQFWPASLRCCIVWPVAADARRPAPGIYQQRRLIKGTTLAADEQCLAH